MRLFLTIVLALAAVVVLWRLLSWLLGLAMGLVWIAVVAAALIFAVGLVRRLMRT
jgi:hypothetical protein